MKQNNATTYISNVLQWAAEEQLFDFRAERVPFIADELSVGLVNRHMDVTDVDWRTVEEALAQYLARQAAVIVRALQKHIVE